MNRILLADDSPHAQRMGERILREEGYEIVSVTDGETALSRLADVDPDLILADVFLPGHSGIDICRLVKRNPKHRHMRVVLTAGLLESFDEEEAIKAGADAIIRKPFEASAVLETIKPLVLAAQNSRNAPSHDALAEAPVLAVDPVPPLAGREKVVPISKAAPEQSPGSEAAGVSEEELLRAAVTLALDAAFPALIEEITSNVLRNLRVVGDVSHPPEHVNITDLPLPFPPSTPDHS